MGKKKDEDAPVVDQYLGSDPADDDLSDMEYIQRDDTSSVDTHPPETKEEADALAEELAAKEKANAEKEKTEEPEAEEDAAVLAEEPEPEPEAEAEPEAEEKEKKVPYERFDDVNKKRKAVEEENARLKAQLEQYTQEKEPEPEPYDYATQEKAAMDALLEGDQDKYTALRSEIRTAERAETLREAQKLASLGDKQLQDNLTFEEMGARIEGEFPEFSTGTDVYNEAAREEMLDLYVGYAKSGLYTRTQALRKAADSAAKIHALGGAAEAGVPDNVVRLKQPDIKKKAKAANQQPPVMESATAREEIRRDVKSMSDEEYAALPESTKKKMRGDIL